MANRKRPTIRYALFRYSLLLLLEVRRNLALLQIRGEIFLDRHVDEGGPDRRAFFRLGIEVLVLDAFRLHRQQHEIAFLPRPLLTVDDRIALALEHVDDEAALVDVLAGLGADVVDEHAPLLQRR